MTTNTLDTTELSQTDTLDFVNIFANYIDANQKTWAHDRAKSVGASEVFGCLRQAWFKKFGEANGFEVDEDFDEDWGAMERGNILEAHFVVPAIRDHLPGHAKLLLAGSRQVTLFHKYNSATPDGLIVNLGRDALKNYGIEDIGESECITFEIKSIDPRVNLHKEKDIHYGQVQTQLGIIREQTQYKPDYGVILYVDASFLSRIKIFVIKFEQKIWQISQDRAEEIMTATNPADLMPEGKMSNACDYCRFQSACARVTVGAIPPDLSKEKNLARVQAMEPLVLQLKDATIAKKLADKKYELTKMEIKEKLTDIGSRKVRKKGEWGVSWSSQDGRLSLNQAAVREALGVEDLEPYKKRGDPFDVLRVTFTAENTEENVDLD